jgi:hypothetical protein
MICHRRRYIHGAIAPEHRHWMSAASGHNGNQRRATFAYDEPTQEAAMAAFAKSWRKE